MHDVIRNLGQPSNYLNKLVDSNSMNNYNDINGIITSSSTSQSILTTATTTNHANSSNTNNTRNGGKSTDNANNNTNNTKNNNSDENIIIKIHNYFDFGLDFIYDTSKSINGSCPIKKIVIHNNPINSLEFGNYEKLFCYFTGYNNKINLLQKEFNNLQKKDIKLTNNNNNINNNINNINNLNNNINNTKITPTSYSPFASDIPRPTPINSNFMSSSSSSATTTNKTATTNKTITANKTTTNIDNDFKNLDEDQFKIYKKLIFDVNTKISIE
ncbi:unnamed protein product [[Candida] boidinii]|uniref:Unnamed protein product n=1 Tax=Candida boidinii TaxID=5477 RepID=A0A9W6T5R2_CANBO|nr:unnamed protein product [[Candida] boidinii]